MFEADCMQMCSDVCRKVFGVPLSDAPKVLNDFVKLGRTEAAAKLCKNREVVRAGNAPLLRLSICLAMLCSDTYGF